VSESSESRFRYKPALDGLRALSVSAVFAYHLEYDWASGGFLGVDIFFVLSGYLITSLLLSEWRHSGTLGVVAFWGRRARRLLPALLLVLLAVAGYALIAPADELSRLRTQSLATLFYVQNWWLVLTGESYFELMRLPSPLRHTWSLSIEEQFYIFWPLLVAACMHGSRSVKRGRAVLLGLCAFGALASAAWMAVRFDPAHAMRVFYGTDTRAQALLVGALLAVGLERWSRLPGGGIALRVGSSLAGLLCLTTLVAAHDRSSALYHGGYLAFSLATAFVIAGSVAERSSLMQGLLSLAPLRWLGWISYGVYLWHWPVIVMLDEARTGLSGPALDVLRIAATLALSSASYVAVERPVRYGKLPTRRLLAVGAAAVAAVTGAISFATMGAQEPYWASSRWDASLEPSLPSDGDALGIAVVGGSIATSLIPGLVSVAATRGIRVFDFTVPGCGLAGRLAVDGRNNLYAWSENCDGVLRRRFRSLRRRHAPQLVVWLSSWDLADQRVGDELLRFGTAEWDLALAAGIDQTMNQIARHGAHVVFLTLPPRAPGLLDLVGPDLVRRREHYNELLRAYARRNATAASVVELGDIVCPGGPPCPPDIDDVTLRPDGGHFSEEGSLWLAQRLLPELVRVQSADFADTADSADSP